MFQNAMTALVAACSVQGTIVFCSISGFHCILNCTTTQSTVEVTDTKIVLKGHLLLCPEMAPVK